MFLVVISFFMTILSSITVMNMWLMSSTVLFESMNFTTLIGVIQATLMPVFFLACFIFSISRIRR